MQNFRSIAREIEGRIKRGVYPVHSSLPSRLELLSEFGVSRATLDHAIHELVRSHRLSSRRGAGTYVLPFDEHRTRVGWIGNLTASSLSRLSLPYDVILPSSLGRRSDWIRLYEYDGLCWDCPEDVLLPVIEEFRGKVPQVVINRTIEGVSCVSTDHRGAYREIAQERLSAHPDGIPIFLRVSQERLPTTYRLDGFADACRERGVFYELWCMSEGFDQRLVQLREHFGTLDPHRPWLIFSDSLRHTGTVMRIAAESGWRWGVDRFYSDFDNYYGRDVWGVKVTSFLQDMDGLREEAGEMLSALIASDCESEQQLKLLFPCRVNGDT